MPVSVNRDPSPVWINDAAIPLQMVAASQTNTDGFAKKQIHNKILEWFQSWRPWQQKMLLCGLTNRCSPTQLELLATTLEPVFHRDYVTKIRHRYPSAPLRKHMKHRKANKSPSRKDRSQQGLPSDKQEEETERPVHSFAQDMAISILLDIQKGLEELQQTNSATNTAASSKDFLDSLNIRDNLERLCIATADVNDVAINKEQETTEETDSQVTKSQKEAECMSKCNKKPFPFLKHSQATSSILRVPAAVEPHLHKNSTRSAIVKTADFFDNKKLFKFGAMQTNLRTGPVKKPNYVRDVVAPLQKLTKNQKWWSEDNQDVYQPHRTTLKKEFNIQLQQIWRWLDSWREHERLTLLSLVAKYCDPEQIDNLSQCLIKRLHEKVNINWLDDGILMYIFSHLTRQEIDTASQVCRRWKYLCSKEDLWIDKCEELGDLEGIPGLVDLVEHKVRSRHDIDWRLAHQQLTNITLDVRAANKLYQSLGELPLQGTDDNLYSANDVFPSRGPRLKLNIARTALSSEGLDTGTKPQSQTSLVRSSFPPASRHSLRSGNKSEEVLKSRSSHKSSTSRRELPPVVDYIKPPSPVDPPTDTQPLKPWIRSRQKAIEEEDDVAFDIRPEIQQATNVEDVKINWADTDSFTGYESDTTNFKGRVKPIHRVRKLQGHMEAVLCVCFDKRRLISGGLDRTIRIWDIRSGRSIHKLYGHKGGISCLQFEQNLLITGSWDMSLMAWDLLEFKRIGFLTGHKGTVSAVHFNDNHIVSSSHDKTVKVWDKRTFLLISTIPAHVHHVTSVYLDLSHVISASSDRTIRMFSLETGECSQMFSGSRTAYTCLTVEGDLIVAGNKKGELFFWNKESGDLEAAIQAHEGAINSVVYWEGHIFTTSNDTSIKEWDIASMSCIRSLHGHKGEVYDLKISEKRMVSCGKDGVVRVWDMFVPTVKLSDENTQEIQVINNRDIISSKS